MLKQSRAAVASFSALMERQVSISLCNSTGVSSGSSGETECQDCQCSVSLVSGSVCVKFPQTDTHLRLGVGRCGPEVRPGSYLGLPARCHALSPLNAEGNFTARRTKPSGSERRGWTLPPPSVNAAKLRLF